MVKNDIAAIIIEFPESKDDILSIIKASKYGNEIIKKYLDLNFIMNEVEIKANFLSALRSVKNGADLSINIDWALSPKDLTKLAKLHKANKCRRKIEELLTDCNFHYECGKFINKEYDEFL